MRFLRGHILRYGTGFTLATGSRLVREMVMARILGPGAMGLWAGLAIYRQYSAYSDLGFTNGLGRVLPLELGSGRTTEARASMGMAWVAAMSASAVFAIITVAIFYRSDSASNPVAAWGVAAIVGLIFLDKQFLYVSMILRSIGRVGTAGLWMGALGVAELALALALAPRFGLYGLFAALLAASVITCALMFATQPMRAQFRFERTAFRRLAVTSFLLMGFGLTTVALHNIDRVAIAYWLGTGSELGQYHIASTLSLVVNVLPYVIVSVITPEIYRFSREHPLELRGYLLFPTLLVSTLGVVVVVGSWLFLPPFLRWALPRFLTVPLLAGALMVGELFYSIAMVAENMVVALDRGIRGLTIRWTTIILGLTSSLFALRAGYGIVAVSLAMCVTHAVGALLIGAIAAHDTRVPMRRYFLVVFGPIIYGAVVVGFAYLAFGAEPAGLALVTLRAAVVLVALAPLAVVPLGYVGHGLFASPRVSQYLYVRPRPSV